jgi:6-phosphogluconolactonase
MQMTNIKLFPNPAAVAAAFADDFSNWVAAMPAEDSRITVAISGGSTPQLLFRLWADEYANKVDWHRVHFFWGDERCVAPEDDESNYGVAKSLFLDRISIEPANIHRIRGEEDPELERGRYEQVIRDHVGIENGSMPVFDLIILGMGDDGHTASIFPHEFRFMNSDRVCEVATHPETGQKRITLTGPVLNSAKRVAFLITGKKKAAVLEQVIHQSGDSGKFPAAHVTAKETDFYLDQAAAKLLSD